MTILYSNTEGGKLKIAKIKGRIPKFMSKLEHNIRTVNGYNDFVRKRISEKVSVVVINGIEEQVSAVTFIKNGKAVRKWFPAFKKGKRNVYRIGKFRNESKTIELLLNEA